MGIFGLHKKLEKKKTKELMEKGEHFLAEYKELSKNYGLDFCAELEVKPDKIGAVLRLRELVDQPAPPAPVQTKPWSQAKRENLEIRKKCKHENLPNQTEHCHKCKLPNNYWGDNMTGANSRYIEKQEAAIADIEKVEVENKEEETEAAKK